MVNCFKCKVQMGSNYYLLGAGKYLCHTCWVNRKRGGK